MERVLLRKAMKFNKNRKRRQSWQRLVRALIMVVVFCTTYALILPAITMGQEAVCGIEPHVHEDACYIEQTLYDLHCTLEPQEGYAILHTHGTACFDADGAPRCALEENPEHVHDADTCYEAAEPACGIPEGEVHSHSDECAVMESVQICTLTEAEAHAHEEGCYAPENVLKCALEETEGHAHGDDCYSAQEVLKCDLEEGEDHTHGDDCYETEDVLGCTLQEAEAHAHSDECYAAEDVLKCGMEETEGHTHTEECFEEQAVPCELEETEGHTHGEECGLSEPVLICEKEERFAHTHEETCYDAEGNLTCELPLAIVHNHAEECLTELEEPLRILSCELTEHLHEDACYSLEEEGESQPDYICGLGLHTHVETCFDEAGQPVCTIPEHTAHTASCIVEDLDPTADVETALQWEEDFAHLILTGNWPADILAVADTQLGYTESEKNLVLEDDQLKGYTRYGEWYGDPYGDWDAMFVSFCLNYAGVEEFPLEAKVDLWTTLLEQKQLYKTPDVHTPAPGDLIFFDIDQKEDAEEEIPVVADKVAIVAELIPAADDAPAQIKLIAGDQENKVGYVTCDADDVTIAGYADIPFGKIFYKTYTGADYTVTVTLGEDSGIPDTAELTVREILSGTEEYDTYYQQSLEALRNHAEENGEEPEVSFARFFDISFLVDGAIVEPAAPVDIQIRYNDSIAVTEDENGMVVHFAEEGVEVLDADTYSSDPEQNTEDDLLDNIVEVFTGETEQVDTFSFTQGSFSVSGTIVTYAARAAGDTYYYKEPTGLDASGGTQYLLYTKANNGKYYAIYSGSGSDADTAIPKEITFNANGSINMNLGRGENANNMLWTLTANGNAYTIKNVGSGKYLHSFDNNDGESITTNGAYATSMVFSAGGEDIGFLLQSNSDFAQINDNDTDFTVGQSADVASTFYLAAPRGNQSAYHVWFDGTNGGLMNLYGSPNTYQSVSANNATFNLPTTWQSPSKYPYVLNGWYDIVGHKYYKPGAEVTIGQNTVFYADWIAADYNVGQNNEHVVNSLDTSDFITTHVFDYNTLFNVQSLAHTGTISATGHSETWTFLEKGTKVSYDADAGTELDDGQKEDSLGFMFVDYDADGDFSYALNRNNDNVNRSMITEGIVNSNSDQAGGLLDMLFNPKTAVIGKQYVGTGNYLFQYMDSTTPNYDGEHDGYYYLDARYNAASYSTDDGGRFYLYDYLERTSDSWKDGGGGQYSDILPFNSPYIFDESRLDRYYDSVMRPGWEYDAKDNYTQNNIQYSEYTDAVTNYFFGIRTDIEFFLPNNVGEKDAYDNYGNISTRGEHMVFDFHGDDDVWVFVDGQLLLDIGGLHGIMHGRIDFSTGTITSGVDGGNEKTTTFTLPEGTHTMTVYYMERGSSQSNCAIYFNIAPRYDLEITKEDIYTRELLDGAEFTIYTCEACAYGTGTCTGEHVAQLWASQEAHELDMNDGVADNTISTMTTVDGKASCWGLAAGKTYYIRETEPPKGYDPGYPRTDDVIRVTLNNRGTASIETTTLHGKDEKVTEGYAVIEQSVDNTLKIVSLTVTNQRDEESTQIRVKKVWDPTATDLPNSITAYLTVDGVQVGRPAVLTEANGWTYTWTGLPKYEVLPDGTKQEIQYEVGEIQVSGFSTDITYKTYEDAQVEWVKTDSMEDNDTYLLLNGGRALFYDGTSFGWMTQADAQDDTTGKNAQWYVTTNQYGFRLTNGSGYSLTYDRAGNYFYGSEDTDAELNQVIYYLDGRLVAHDNDLYFQFNTGGASVSADGLVFSLIRKDLIQGVVAEIENTLIPNEDHTFVEVNKVWDDFEDHTNDAVTMHLYANGVDTGREAVLNSANGWHAVFDGLPYQDEDGNVIVYTILEDEPEDYDAEYEYSTLDGKQIVTWVKQDSLTEEGTYRIVNGANALAVNDSGALVVAVNDPNNTNQWWTPVRTGNRMVLKHSTRNVYLTVTGNSVSTTTSASSAYGINLNGEVLSLTSGNSVYYLQMTKTAVTVSQSAYNATLFTVALRTEGQGNAGTGVLVTNIEEIGYELPETGGMGTSHLTLGGVLMIVSAGLMYICITGRKRRKGGR